MSEPSIFKCEASMWDWLAEEGVTGIPAKPFDMRRWDLGDDRIYRLAWGSVPREDGPERVQMRPDVHLIWQPDEHDVTFLNKETGETLTRKYLGMEFTPWAPGWVFLILGERVPS